MILIVLTIAGGADGQIRRSGGRRPPIRVLLEASPAVSNLFARAEEGASRRDWKFTIDCLQRIIENPEGSLVARPDDMDDHGRLYESARRLAIRQLAALPPEGLQAYRLLYDGRARRLFDKGRREHDTDALRDAANLYLLSRFGDDAADLLASWALDGGRPSEAVMYLHDLLELVPDADVPQSLIASKLAAAYALLGQTDEAWAAMTLAQGNDELNPALRRLEESLPTAPDESVARAGGAWPVVGGTPARGNVMPPVEPAIVETVPWRYELPDAAPGAWRRVFRDDADGPLVLPVGQPVADRQRLFVRTPHGCVALDRQDLIVQWEAEVSAGASLTAPRLETAVNTPPVPRPLTDADIAFEDYVAGSISTGYGLVTIITREGRSAYAQGSRDAGRGRSIRWLPIPTKTRSPAEGTRLIAYDARTGEVRWERGRTGDADDPLGAVNFRAAPLAIDRTLWVPYFRQQDFYVAVLDPSDGALLNNIVVCSISAPSRTVLSAYKSLPPAYGNGIVYIPTGHGILVAVNAFDRTLKWAFQYKESLASFPADEPNQPRTRWLPSPPVAVGGLVLLTPVEDTRLIALTGATGELRWTRTVKNGAYIIAADQQHVWIGGRTISCLSCRDGETLWETDTPSTPTGRAVMSGDVVQVPLLDGLLSLDAAGGDAIEYAAIPASEDPLGNPLSIDEAMLIVGPSTIRKFPDIERSFPTARARYEADPTNVADALRIAWLELLRGNPREAHTIIERIPPEALERNRRRADALSHVRVESLLVLARQAREAGGTQDEALALMEQADRSARTPTDRLRCGQAIVTQLAAMRRSADAYRRLWDLGIGDAGREIVMQNERVETMARFVLADRLTEIAPTLDGPNRRRLGTQLTERVDRQIADLRMEGAHRRALKQLRAVADVAGDDPLGDKALAAMASYNMKAGRFERAEQILRERLRRRSGAGESTVCDVDLAELYAGAIEAGVDCTCTLVGCLKRIETNRAATHSATPTAEWVAHLRSTIPPDRLDTCRAGDEPRAVELTGTESWSKKAKNRSSPPRLFHFDTPAAAALRERALFYEPGDVVTCFAAETGELLWTTELRGPESFGASMTRGVALGKSGARRAVIDGETVVIRAEDGLYAVGLPTGRRLWYRPFDDPARHDPASANDLRMAAGDGLLAAMPGSGRLSLIRMQDGTTIWERDLRGEPVDRVWMFGDRVVTADRIRRRVHLFDRRTGRQIQRVLFEQPDPDRHVIPLVATGGVMCGPSATSTFEGVIGVDLSTGETRWRVRLDKPISQLFTPKAGYLGIGLLGGDVRIVDVSSGDLLLDRHVAGAHVVVDGALVDGTLLVEHYATRETRSMHTITAQDIATGDLLWEQNDLMVLTALSDALTSLADRIPVARRIVNKNKRQRRKELRISLLDVRTGSPVGPHATVARTDSRLQLNGDFVFFPAADVIIVGTDRTVMAIKTTTPSRTNQGL